MTLTEMKTKVLALIEEINPSSTMLTDDPDISTKINDVINQVVFELARIKKIPRYVELQVNAGDLIGLADIAEQCGNAVYQIEMVKGVEYQPKASGTVLKIMGTGTAEIDCFVYPQQISSDTEGEYEFELSQDALEIAPYGIAADLLKSDVSAEYGAVYATRYETMLQRLDPRYSMTSIYIEEGV